MYYNASPGTIWSYWTQVLLVREHCWTRLRKLSVLRVKPPDFITVHSDIAGFDSSNVYYLVFRRVELGQAYCPHRPHPAHPSFWSGCSFWIEINLNESFRLWMGKLQHVSIISVYCQWHWTSTDIKNKSTSNGLHLLLFINIVHFISIITL